MFGRRKSAPICLQLEKNELEEISFGMCESSSFNNKRDVRAICEALLNNNNKNSSITKVNIGPKLDLKSLNLVLESVVTKLSAIKSLHLQLSVVVLPTIINLKKCKTLERFEVYETLVRMDSQTTSDESYFNFCDIVQSLPNIKTLKLIACGIDDDQILDLYKSLRKNKNRLEEISLARNWRLTECGLSLLCKLSVCRLDVSECDIQGIGFQILSQGLLQKDEKETSYCVLRELDVSSNLQLSKLPIKELLQFIFACCQKLKLLDISYCGLCDNQVTQILQFLMDQNIKDDENSTSTLKILILRDCPPQVPVELLQSVVNGNTSLQCLVLEDDSKGGEEDETKDSSIPVPVLLRRSAVY